MSLIPIGFDSALQQKIVDRLIATSEQQVLIDPNVGFSVFKNRSLAFDRDTENFPLVNILIDSNDPTSASTGRTYEQLVVNFNVDLYAHQDNPISEPPDLNATNRLMYLRDQVKFSICSLKDPDFGFPKGIISKKKWPSFQQFKPDTSNSEIIIASGRLRFEFEYSFDPEQNELLDLKSINVDTDTWGAKIDYT